MKHTRKRIFSMITAGVMTASMLPAYLTQISIPAAADDPPAKNAADTNPTIDFDYADNHNILNADDAMKDLGKKNKNEPEWKKITTDETLKGSYSSYPWQHPTMVSSTLTAPHKGTNTEQDLRKLLQEHSSDPDEVKYIALPCDVGHEWTINDGQQWVPIRITSNKVLDLNGHKIWLNYFGNKNHHDKKKEQEYRWVESHYLTAFEIDDGATLTIIDSSAWRGDDSSPYGTGQISFDAAEVDHYDWALRWYDHRDLFHVTDGNLIIYGGNYLAGSNRVLEHDESNFSWSKLKSCIGTAVELGVNVAKYATGITEAEAMYNDVLQGLDKTTGEVSAKPKSTPESQKGTPSGENDKRNQSVNEKAKTKNADIEAGGKGEKENQKANEAGTAKDDKNTRVAKAQNEIVNKATSSDGIMGMVNSGFTLIDSVCGMFGTTSKPRITNSIKGTVVRVESGGTFASYGGHYVGNGSTPNIRNAVIEVQIDAEEHWTLDYSKQSGGKAYIYDGLFEANSGANVFNMYQGVEESDLDAIQYTAANATPKTVKITYDEHYGVEPLYYQNQVKLKAGQNVEPEPINTANVQVRGGTFKCSFDAMNMAKKESYNEKPDDVEYGDHFNKFPGTYGSVNLGVNSFGADLIRDGRIQITDNADGCLVLLDDQEEGYDGLFHYRLFCGDNELRTKAYLRVYPNEAQNNSSFSMQLSYYNGSGKQTKELYKDDKDNIRSPYRQMENYFDFQLDDKAHRGAYSVMPNFHKAAAKDNGNNQFLWDVYGEKTAASEVWFYPAPLDKEGNPIGDTPYGNACMYFFASDKVSSSNYFIQSEEDLLKLSTTWKNAQVDSYGQKVLFDRDICEQKDWNNILKYSNSSSVEYVSYKGIRTNMKYFTYKVYQVDPLTRENLNANNCARGDDPLLTVRYGCAPEETALKCKLPLDEVEERIQRIHPEWQGYRAGEMYRIVLEVEEQLGIGEKPLDGVVGNFRGFNNFGQKLRSAKTTTSILFRCFEKTEQYRSIHTDGNTIYEEKYLNTNFTPVQWPEYQTSMHTIPAGRTHTIEVRNGKTGITDWKCDTRIFDLYYQWWEVDKNGKEIRLLAGTDNVYVDGLDKYDERGTVYSATDKDKHSPDSWDLYYENKDGKRYLYANTVDPDDPNAADYENPEELNLPNVSGLPKVTEDGKWDWSPEQIHMYASENTDPDDLFFSKDHNPENNNIFANNTDSCYIPKELIGKRIRVKVIALNVRWPLAYDKKQTFWSHTMEVCDPNSPEGYLNIETDEKETFGENVPATFSVKRLRDFYDSSKIASVTYIAYGKAKQFAYDKESVKSSISALPSARYPKDFSDTMPTGFESYQNYNGTCVLLGLTDDFRLKYFDDILITRYVRLDLPPKLYGRFTYKEDEVTPEKPDPQVTFSISQLEGLEAGETVSAVIYHVNDKYKVFNNLSIYDMKDLPEARYPVGFTDKKETAQEISLYREGSINDAFWVEVITGKGSRNHRRIFLEEDIPAVQGKAVIKYDKDMSYATYDHPATFSLEDLKLPYGESLFKISYRLLNTSSEKSVEYNVLDDKDKFKDGLPAVKYPDYFYKAEKRNYIGNHERLFEIVVTTTRNGKYFRDLIFRPENYKGVQYVIKAQEIHRIGDETEEFKVSDIQNGKYDKGISAFSVHPMDSTIGFSFSDCTNTNDKVAVLVQDPNISGWTRIMLTGEPGEATFTMKSPDGETVSKTVRVYQEFDSIQISGIKPPVIGEKFDFDSIKVPDDALYHITDVTWEKGSNPRTRKTVGKDETAAYFEPYTVCVTVEPDEFARVSDNFAYSIYAEQADGTQNNVSEGTKMWRNFDEETNSYLNSYTFEYTYPAQSNHEAKVIDRIYIDFPTEVKEGDNFIKWLEDVNVYTNGYDEGLEFKLTPTFGPDAEAIAKAYGFKATSTTTEQLNYFIKGLQNGLNVVITIPKKQKETGDIFAASSDIKVYINGEEGGNLTWTGDGSLWVTASDTLTITDGEFNPPEKPVYSVKNVDAVVGEPIKVEDLLVTDNPKVTIRSTGIRYEYGWEDYMTADFDNGIFTPIDTVQSSNGIRLTYVVEYDEDGDGYPEYQDSNSVVIQKIYATAEDVPTPETPPVEDYGTAKVIVQNPDGKEVSEVDFKIRSGQDIPDPDGTFIIGFYDADGKKTSDYYFENGKTYYAKTVAADDMEIHAGVNSAYAFIRLPSGSVMGGFHISADGTHYLVGDYLRDLNPDTDYTLYYKRGADGKVYSKSFRTAKQDYGVMLGHDFVTDENLGDLEQDGWHYDPDTRTLTLKNFTLNDFGAEAYKIELYGVTGFYTAAIASKDTLTLNLIGENRIAFSDSDLFTSTIFAEKDLTITGNGNLTLAGKAKYGLHSHTGNICLNGTRTLSLKGDYGTGFYGFYPENGEVLYTNGTIAVHPMTKTNYKDEPYQFGFLIEAEDAGKLKFSGKVHDIKIEAAGLDGKFEAVAESDFAALIQENIDNLNASKYDAMKCAIRITPVHKDVNKTVSSEVYYSGSCDSGCTYHLSCDCGHIGEETFEMPAEEHSFIKHPAKAATCEEPGAEAYWECEICGECFADAAGSEPVDPDTLTIPAAGHKLKHHAAVEATCGKAGIIEYWSCETCGKYFADEKGTVRIFSTNLTVPATGHDWVQRFAKPATCEKDGAIAHWVCSHCGQCSADKDGTKLLEKEDVIIKAFGHEWSEWTVSRAATATEEGEEIRTCGVCGETVTRVIPVKAPETTTKATTTTTSTTKETTTTTSTSTTKATTTTTSTTKETTTTTSTTKETTTTTSTTKATTTTTSMTKETTTTTSTTKATTTTTSTTKATTTTTSTTKETTTTTSTTKETTTTTSTTKETTTTTSTTKATTTTTSTTKETTTTTSTTKATTTTTSTTKTTTTTTSTTKETTTTTCTTVTESDMTTSTSVTVTSESEAETSETTVTTGETTPTEPEVLTGDVNGDGAISVDDAQLTLNAYVKSIAGKEHGLSEKQVRAADVNEDGTVSVDDAQTILIYYVKNSLAGVPTTWEQLLGRNKPAQELPVPAKLREFFPDYDTESGT